jgi:hypothetical protein
MRAVLCHIRPSYWCTFSTDKNRPLTEQTVKILHCTKSNHCHSLSLNTESVSIVSDYRLDGAGVRYPAEAKYLSSRLCVQTSWGPPIILYNGHQGSFPGVKARPGSYADHSPHLVPRSRMSGSYTPSPRRLHGSSGISSLYFFYSFIVLSYTVMSPFMQ